MIDYHDNWGGCKSALEKLILYAIVLLVLAAIVAWTLTHLP